MDDEALLHSFTEPPDPKDAELLKQFVPDEAPAEPTAIAGAPMGGGENPWTQGKDFANDFLLGQGIKIPALAAALNGPGSFGENYNYALTQLQGNRERFAQENPKMALANSLGASLPLTIAGMAAGQEYVAAPMLAKAAQIFPKVAPAVGRFLGGAAGGNMLTRGASLASRGALEGGEAAGLQSGMHDEPIGQQIARGMEIGAIANPVFNALVPGIKYILNAGVSPAAASQAAILTKAGIEVKPSQITSDQDVRDVAARLHAGGDSKQLSDLTQAYAEKMGIHGERELTPQMLADRKDQLSHGFTQVADRIPNVGDAPLIKDLQNIWDEARTYAGDSTQLKTIGNFIKSIADKASTGSLDGQMFRTYTRTTGPLYSHLMTDQNKHYGSQIVSALYDALQRNAPADDVATLTQLRSHWKALSQLEPVVKKGEPLLSPSMLQTAKLMAKPEPYGDLGQAVKLLKGVKPTGQGGSVAAGTRRGLSTILPEILSGGLGGLASSAVNIAQGEGVNSLYAGIAGAGAAATRGLQDLYTKNLLNRDYLRKLYIARGLGAAPPTMPLDIVGARALGESALPMAVNLGNNRSQQ